MKEEKRSPFKTAYGNGSAVTAKGREGNESCSVGYDVAVRLSRRRETSKGDVVEV